MSKLPATGRMEAFSDGVIAVIITIMVLEFKVPKEAGLAGLKTMAPALAVYALSFTFTGIYWVNHHHMVDRCKHVDGLILWMNLQFLFCISLIPFFTEYAVAHQLDPFSVGLYAASMMVDGVSFTLLSRAILRHLQRAGEVEGKDEAKRAAAEQAAESGKGYLSVAMYLVAVPLAHWHPRLALGVTALITAIWIVPGFMVKPVAAEVAGSHRSCRKVKPLRQAQRVWRRGVAMRSRMLGWVFGCVLAMGGVATAQTPVPVEPPQPDQLRTLTRDELDIVKVLTAQERAWNHGDLEAYAMGYKNSPDLLFVGRQISRGFGSLVEDYRKNYPNKEAMGMLAFSELEPHVLDEHYAVMLGHYHLERSKKGGGPADGIFSLVLEKTDKGWKIVVDHTT